MRALELDVEPATVEMSGRAHAVLEPRLLPALLKRVRAARAELATLRRVDERRRRSLDRVQALDVTIQAQIVELISQLKDDFNSGVIMITHDLGVVADIADEIIVMYAGQVVERATTRELFYDPQMPYTWGLLGSIPRLDRPRPERLHSIKGSPPSLITLPQGCKFRPRCPHAFDKCMEDPTLENRVETPGHLDRCWLDVEYKRSARVATIAGDATEAA